MADRAHAVAENVPGPFFVDTTCIDCDTCRQIAPATFGETAEFSFVQLQPRDALERRAAMRALIACPTGSIGTQDKRGVAEALNDFPLPLAADVFYCGFNSRKSFGAERVLEGHTPVALSTRFTSISTNDGLTQSNEDQETSRHQWEFRTQRTGAFLSGGMDSSSIVTFASERASPLSTFTIVFGDAHSGCEKIFRGVASGVSIRSEVWPTPLS